MPTIKFNVTLDESPAISGLSILQDKFRKAQANINNEVIATNKNIGDGLKLTTKEANLLAKEMQDAVKILEQTIEKGLRDPKLPKTTEAQIKYLYKIIESNTTKFEKEAINKAFEFADTKNRAIAEAISKNTKFRLSTAIQTIAKTGQDISNETVEQIAKVKLNIIEQVHSKIPIKPPKARSEITDLLNNIAESQEDFEKNAATRLKEGRARTFEHQARLAKEQAEDAALTTVERAEKAAEKARLADEALKLQIAEMQLRDSEALAAKKAAKIAASDAQKVAIREIETIEHSTMKAIAQMRGVKWDAKNINEVEKFFASKKTAIRLDPADTAEALREARELLNDATNFPEKFMTKFETLLAKLTFGIPARKAATTSQALSAVGLVTGADISGTASRVSLQNAAREVQAVKTIGKVAFTTGIGATLLGAFGSPWTAMLESQDLGEGSDYLRRKTDREFIEEMVASGNTPIEKIQGYNQLFETIDGKIADIEKTLTTSGVTTWFGIGKQMAKEIEKLKEEKETAKQLWYNEKSKNAEDYLRDEAMKPKTANNTSTDTPKNQYATVEAYNPPNNEQGNAQRNLAADLEEINRQKYKWQKKAAELDADSEEYKTAIKNAQALAEEAKRINNQLYGTGKSTYKREPSEYEKRLKAEEARIKASDEGSYNKIKQQRDAILQKMQMEMAGTPEYETLVENLTYVNQVLQEIANDMNIYKQSMSATAAVALLESKGLEEQIKKRTSPDPLKTGKEEVEKEIAERGSLISEKWRAKAQYEISRAQITNETQIERILSEAQAQADIEAEGIKSQIRTQQKKRLDQTVKDFIAKEDAKIKEYIAFRKENDLIDEEATEGDLLLRNEETEREISEFYSIKNQEIEDMLSQLKEEDYSISADAIKTLIEDQTKASKLYGEHKIKERKLKEKRLEAQLSEEIQPISEDTANKNIADQLAYAEGLAKLYKSGGTQKAIIKTQKMMQEELAQQTISAKIEELKQILALQEEYNEKGLDNDKEITKTRIELAESETDLIEKQWELKNAKQAAFYEKMKVWQETSLEIFQIGVNTWKQLEANRIEENYKAEKEGLDKAEKLALDKAAGEQERLSLEKQFANERIKLEREELEKKKALRKKEATIEYAMALLKITLSNILTPWNIIPQIAVASAQYASSMILINQEKLEKGGMPKKGGEIKGKSHKQGGVPFLFGGTSYEAEAGELAIISQNAAKSSQLLTATGTTMQIASAINQFGGGDNFAPGGIAAKMQNGGLLGKMYLPQTTNTSTEKTSSSEIELMKRHITALEKTIITQKVIIDPHELRTYNDKFVKQSKIGTL